ncbi:DNA polymerase III subunit delta [Hahella sp. CCB-MM4]|uniref:DNA polymerase III subunit delta n=1 Tax=Hahella sp. (strain CCB-MM4) TaxID=1926491 RepID=UPI000B9A764F|nr:DNA polymerase III subunit delta [Hahella sp. CCB-MM4]OZG72384.1 DNA polymerase III subunit delta [Hahella sp. CCB-MM4]
MRIRPDQLTQSLKKNPPGIFVVSGDEPLLLQEACDEIRKYCKSQEFLERLAFHAPKNFDWGQLDEHTQSFSLFGEKKLIELHLESLPNDAGKKSLQAWANQPPEDACLLLISGKIESSTLNTKWFKAIESHCLHVQIWPINHDQLPQWVTQRMQRVGFHPTAAAVKALCDHVEGNLLAAQQEIEKLRLLNTQEQVDVDDILKGIASSNKYTVFNLVDACLERDAKHAVKILQTLQAESFEPSIVLWSLSRETRVLAKLFRARQAGRNIEQVLQQERVFKNKWPLYKKYMGKASPAYLPKLHHHCQLADKAIKGLESQSPWSLLMEASLLLAGVASVKA